MTAPTERKIHRLENLPGGRMRNVAFELNG